MARGISVSTVGLGLDYNEDLMTELALRSDGRHTFVKRASELAAFLDEELTSVTSVVARDADVHIQCRGGARPLRVLGRSAEIVGQTVTTTFGKVYGGREHFLLIELEVPAEAAAGDKALADVEVTTAICWRRAARVGASPPGRAFRATARRWRAVSIATSWAWWSWPWPTSPPSGRWRSAIRGSWKRPAAFSTRTPSG